MDILKHLVIIRFIKKAIATDKVYLGVSAGSIVAGSDISIAGPFDKNDSGITDFSGIELANIVVSLHYVTEEEKIISNLENQLGITVTRITDNQAILINDSGIIVVERFGIKTEITPHELLNGFFAVWLWKNTKKNY